MKRLTKNLVLSVSLAAAGLAMSGGAQARGDVYWSVGVDAPVMVGGNVHTEFSNAPQVRYVQPQPVIVTQAPVVIQQPQPVYVQRPWCPPRVVYAPQPVVVMDRYPQYGGGGWRFQRDRWGDERREWRHERWEHERHEHHGHRDRD